MFNIEINSHKTPPVPPLAPDRCKVVESGSVYFAEVRDGTSGTVSDWLTSERGRIIGQ